MQTTSLLESSLDCGQNPTLPQPRAVQTDIRHLLCGAALIGTAGAVVAAGAGRVLGEDRAADEIQRTDGGRRRGLRGRHESHSVPRGTIGTTAQKGTGVRVNWGIAQGVLVRAGWVQGPHAGQRALHTCTSWYAYAAMFGSSHSYAQHSSQSGSLYFDWPCFGSHNRWLKYNTHGKPHPYHTDPCSRLGQICEIWLRVRNNVGREETDVGRGGSKTRRMVADKKNLDSH